MKFTSKLPNKEGYYWWTNFGEHTPTIVKVEREGKSWYASNEEFTIHIKKPKIIKDPDLMVDGHYYGEEMWCYIPVPTMGGKKIEPDCY